MKKFLLLPLFIASSAFAQQPDSSSSLFSMREAEWNFARQSVMFGRNAAFIENLAEYSVMFTGKWVTNSLQLWKERRAVPVVLKWEPEFMDIAGSRDFGISTGPWELQEFRPNTKPLSTGYFLTVWRKQSDGVWKVILDAGSDTPPVKGTPHKFIFPAGADKDIQSVAFTDTAISCRELTEREKQFDDEFAKSQGVSVFKSYFAPGARIQQNGHLPTTNQDTIKIWISKRDKSLRCNTAGSGAASSGDMGFTYGLLEIQGNPSVTKGHYIRIWKKQESKWLIIMEMTSIDKP
jgi:ketosteroid isomerase-like protein